MKKEDDLPHFASPCVLQHAARDSVQGAGAGLRGWAVWRRLGRMALRCDEQRERLARDDELAGRLPPAAGFNVHYDWFGQRRGSMA